MDGLVYSMCIICGILELNMGDSSDTSIFILRKIENTRMDGLVYPMCIICGILEVNMGDTSDTFIFILRKIESRNLSLSLCQSVSLSVC